MFCIILAGGFATRLWPLTENKAKPLLHLKDKPLISHIVEKLPREVPIIVSTNAVFREAFLAWREGLKEREIEIFVEDSLGEESKKGALGATALVIQEKNISDDLLLIAGDNYFGFKMDDFMRAFTGSPLLAAYDILDRKKASRFGVVVTHGNRVVEFQEKPTAPKSTLVSTGCYIFPEKNLADIVAYAQEKHDDLGGIFEYFMQKGQRVEAFPFKEPWYDIGSFEAYLSAHHELMQGQAIVAPSAVVSRSNLHESVYVGPHVTVTDCELKNVVVLEGTRLSNCVIENAVIDENCDLENLDLKYQMVRRGSKIEK